MPPAPDASPPALRPRRRLSDPSQREASPSTSGSSGSSGSGTVGGSTGSGLAAPEVPWDEVIRQLARGVPLKTAAAACRLGSTCFKRALRGHGLSVWPYRSVESVRRALLEHARWLHDARGSHMRARVERELAVLEAWQRDLLADPRRFVDGRAVRVPPAADRIIKNAHKRGHKRLMTAADALLRHLPAGASLLCGSGGEDSGEAGFEGDDCGDDEDGVDEDDDEPAAATSSRSGASGIPTV